VDEHFLPLEAQVGEDVECRFRDELPAADMVFLDISRYQWLLSAGRQLEAISAIRRTG
jgi:hypothetical protein